MHPIIPGELDAHVGLSFPTGEAIGPEGPSWCNAVPAWRVAMRSDSSRSPYPSNAIPPGLYGPGVASASAPGSWMFTVVSCLVASWSCEGGLTQE